MQCNELACCAYATVSAMSVFRDLNLLHMVERRVKNGFSHRAIVQELKSAFPGVRGISVRSLKRFCADENIHATSRCSDQVLDTLVAYGAGLVSCGIVFICSEQCIMF